MKIAEELKRLGDFNQKRMDDDDNNDDGNGFGPPLFLSLPPPFGLPLYNPPSPSIFEDDDKTEKDFTPAQKFLLVDTAKALPFSHQRKSCSCRNSFQYKYKFFPIQIQILSNTNSFQKPMQFLKITSRNYLMTQSILVDLK